MISTLFQWCRTAVQRGLGWLERKLLRLTKPRTATTVVGAMGDALRSRQELLLENALLRQQIVILKRSVRRVQPTDTDRGILVWLASLLQSWRTALLVVKPATVLSWHRTLFRLYWRRKSRAGVGHPPLASDTIALIQQMAAENRLWSAERIRGELLGGTCQQTNHSEIHAPGSPKTLWRANLDYFPPQPRIPGLGV